MVQYGRSLRKMEGHCVKRFALPHTHTRDKKQGNKDDSKMMVKISSYNSM